MSSLADQSAREQALDVSGSYIVQAPAGSGKTELLSMRYLRLLSICEKPEEILAITFTRKAASEMKNRIIEALRMAAESEAPQDSGDPLKMQRYRIARAALEQSRSHGWQILDNPARLRIQTIDSFCLGLASRIPLLSRLGGVPNLSDDVSECFSDAIRNTLQELDSGSPLAEDIARLLGHLDNDVGRVEKLLLDLLGHRDQWLTYILGLQSASLIDRQYLQQALTELIEESLEEVRNALLPFEAELVELINHAVHYLPSGHPRRIENFPSLIKLPACTPSDLPCWLLLDTILLKKTDADWRMTINKNDGFPASITGDKAATAICKARKQQWSDLLERLRANHELREAIAYLRLLPDPSLEDRQWELLTALARILTQLSSQLLLSFRRFRRVDHPQVAAAALSALGPDEEPTDLALALDHRLQHILVDEFQDTSKMQTDLLKKLTAGWVPEDGRTLFLVGDAMQSVYSFRNANVGIYLSVREEGLGDIPLQSLTLQSNFRSQANVVDWVNSVFEPSFPAQANPSRGAVPYSASVACNPGLDRAGISVELISHDADQKAAAGRQEALQVVRHVVALKEADPDSSVAILVRSRSHLRTLIPALRAAGIHWQATDIDKLESLPVIEDLQSLTRAILNLGDRVAWLAILRAPWVGLTLSDLHAIATYRESGSIWYALENYQDIARLSDDGRERLRDFVRVLAFGLRLRFKVGLRRLVESLWTLLGGASFASHDAEQASVAHFLDLLEQHENGGTLRDYQEFSGQVANAYIPSINQDDDRNAVHILTMHKAKGLEFDHVILPCLGAGARSDEKPLLEWHERVNQHGEPRLFIAALSASGKDDDPLYRLVRFEEQRKSRYEDVRLLYIATTRARKSALLTATLGRDSQGEATPTRGSLLRYIWPRLQELGSNWYTTTPLEAFSAANDLPAGLPESPVTTPATAPIQRFESAYRLDSMDRQMIDNALPDAGDENPPAAQPPGTESAVEPAATVGTLIHQAMETLVTDPEVYRDGKHRTNLQKYWRAQLEQLVTDRDVLDEQLQFIESSINNCLADPECQWVFDPQLPESSTELSVSRRLAGRHYNFVVDRTFIDQDGTRWIIDYKTAAPAPGSDLEQFIREQVILHRAQLTNYRRVFEELEPRPVKTALLFTALPRLVELE